MTPIRWLRDRLRRHGPLWYAWKVALSLATVGFVGALYWPVGELTAGRSFDLMTPLDAAIPFVPWTWWIYFPGYLFGLLFAVLAMRDDGVYYRSIAAIMLAQVFNSVVYLLIPSTFPRPWEWQGTGLTADAIHWYWTVDPPNNTFPSSHVALASLAALGMWRERNPLRLVPTLTALGIFVTVHTTKQHYWIDAVAGVGMGFLCHWLVFDAWPRWRGRGAAQPPPSTGEEPSDSA